ncbi:MAG: sigma-70 family RNA polymerase sigma factor [Candidatus Nanopelagicales bacterium]
MPKLPADRVEVASARPLMAVESFESFFRREFPGLVTLAYALTGSRQVAEDIAQDAMLTAYRRWDQIVRLEHNTAYVRRTCANMAVSSMRRRWAESRALVRLGGRRAPTQSLPEEDERFWKEVRRLPTRQSQAVALHYGCDLSVSDVAAAMGTTESTVKTPLVRARQSLAGRFGDQADTDSSQDGPR